MIGVRRIPWLTFLWVLLALVGGIYVFLGRQPIQGQRLALETLDRQRSGPFVPLSYPLGLDQGKVALGELLFQDARLSVDQTIACASCHPLAMGGADRRAKSLGVNGAQGAMNAPTVFNSSLNFRQFWDGRAANLLEQIDGPLEHPSEMANTWAEVLRRLKLVPEYDLAFAKLYPDGLTIPNIKDAIVLFERSLVTPARFDRYLQGDRGAMSETEIAGLRLFESTGCVSCHQGINVGGNMYQKLGVMVEYFPTKTENQADFGRFNVTHQADDRFFFKVPSLRNVAVTGPYLHDGSIRTLEEVIHLMARYQLDTTLSSHEVSLIVAFLGTLTGEYKGIPLK